MDKAELTSLFEAFGLSDLWTHLVPTLRASIKIKLEPQQATPLGDSKIGGMPDLPVNIEWPHAHGKPLAFYSDKHGIFRVNHAAGSKSGTQFGRVLHDIGVELICANSPQAKGRVERANKTLQDRLIKEMRLNKISSIEEANAWLETFIVNFNQRFAKTPKYPKNLHRPVAETISTPERSFSTNWLIMAFIFLPP